MYYSMPINMFFIVKSHWEPSFTDNPRRIGIGLDFHANGITNVTVHILKKSSSAVAVTLQHSGTRHYATSQKAAGSRLSEVKELLNLPISSGHTRP
jgi:hypothetical protein